jgi:hypothetical protein
MTETWDSDPQLASDHDVTVYQVPGTDVQYAGADTDGDRLEDTWAYDYNGDGTPEAVGADGGHDGAPDAWLVSDSTGDGAVYYADTNGNNLPDPWETTGYVGNPHDLEPASDWMHGY